MVSWLCPENLQTHKYPGRPKESPHLHAKVNIVMTIFSMSVKASCPFTVKRPSSWSVGQLTRLACVETVLIITELEESQEATVIEQLRDELTCAHSGIFVGKARMAVMAVTTRTSTTGYLPNWVVFRFRHQAMLVRIKAPHSPPNMPSRMKGTSSKRCHGV